MEPKAKEKAKRSFAQGLTFQTEPTDRKDGRILVASGTKSRNRDYYTGKPFRLVPSGMRFDAWGKTGLVLYMHNFNIPLGRSSLYLEDGMLWSPDTIDFHRKTVPIATNNWIGDAIGEFDSGVIADLWEERYLNSVSIHVMLTMEDEQNVVELEDELLVPTSEVIEFSVVTVPGDREANRERLLSMGLDPAFVECVTCDDISQRKSGLLVREPDMQLANGDIGLGSGTEPEGRTTTYSIQLEVSDMEPEEQDVEVTEESDLASLVQKETHIETEVPEVEVNELVAEEEVLSIPILDMVQALAEDEEALMVLARAFSANPAVIQVFVEGLKENSEALFFGTQELETLTPGPRKIQFVSSAKKPERTMGRIKELSADLDRHKGQTLADLQQVPENPDYSGRDPKRRQRVLGLVRSP